MKHEDKATTLCNAWIIRFKNDTFLGFTDHDKALVVEGVECAASTGFTAASLSLSTGLSVDNTEAIGALSHTAITSADIALGRYDGAEIRVFSVDWSSPSVEPQLLFRGHIGEISEVDGTFKAELRGLAEALNKPIGRVFQQTCDAQLGDNRCGVDLGVYPNTVSMPVVAVDGSRTFKLENKDGLPEHWFEGGLMSLSQSDGFVHSHPVKADTVIGGFRFIVLWQEVPVSIAPGTKLTLIAGCNKTGEVCQKKFNNFINFRGFPHVPGEDWQLSYPNSRVSNDGGRR